MSESGKYLLRKPGLLGPSQQIPSEHTSLLACFSACVDSSVYSCMCIYMLTRTRRTRIHIYIYIYYKLIHMYIYIYMRIYMYIRQKLITIYICVCVCAWVFLDTCIHDFYIIMY